MNLFLIFAFVLATILLSIVLERILNSPTLIALTFFAIYLVILAILFAAGIVTNLAIGLIAVIILTIIAFITAVIVRFIRCICRKFLGDCCSLCPGRNRGNDEDTLSATDNQNGNLLTVSCRCNNGNSQDLLSINSNCLDSGNDDDNNSSCCCGNRGGVSMLDDRNKYGY